MKHIVIIPYSYEQDIENFKKTGKFLINFSKNKSEYIFLLVNHLIKSNKELLNIFSKIAPVEQMESVVPILGAPEGVAATFWEIMDYINQNYEKDGGFVLWFEPDMIPIRENWVDILAEEWRKHTNALIIGMYVQARYCKKTGFLFPEHINGGACYAKDLASQVPLEYKSGVCDMSLFQYIKKTRRHYKCNFFNFSHQYSLLSDMKNRQIVILHGYLQDKDEFLSKVIRLLSNPGAGEENILNKSKSEKQICCDQATVGHFFVNCSIHSRNLFFKCYNRLVYYMKIIERSLFLAKDTFVGKGKDG